MRAKLGIAMGVFSGCGSMFLLWRAVHNTLNSNRDFSIPLSIPLSFPAILFYLRSVYACGSCNVNAAAADDWRRYHLSDLFRLVLFALSALLSCRPIDTRGEFIGHGTGHRTRGLATSSRHHLLLLRYPELHVLELQVPDKIILRGDFLPQIRPG